MKNLAGLGVVASVILGSFVAGCAGAADGEPTDGTAQQISAGGEHTGEKPPLEPSRSDLPGAPTGPATGGASGGSPGTSGTPSSSSGGTPAPGTGVGGAKSAKAGWLELITTTDFGHWATQCTDATRQATWETKEVALATGHTWALSHGTQQPDVAGISPSCGSVVGGHYPLRFNTLTLAKLPKGTQIVLCSSTVGQGDLYSVTGTALDGTGADASSVYVEARYQRAVAQPTCK